MRCAGRLGGQDWVIWRKIAILSHSQNKTCGRKEELSLSIIKCLKIGTDLSFVMWDHIFSLLLKPFWVGFSLTWIWKHPSRYTIFLRPTSSGILSIISLNYTFTLEAGTVIFRDQGTEFHGSEVNLSKFTEVRALQWAPICLAAEFFFPNIPGTHTYSPRA